MVGEESLWVGISELARRKNIDKGAISRKIARLESDGLLKTRPGPLRGKHRSKLVNVADYDVAIGQVGDLAKEAGAATKAAEAAEIAAEPAEPAAAPGLARFRDVQADKMGFEAELKKLELAKLRRQLVPLAEMQVALTKFAAVIVRVIDALPAKASAAHAAGLKDGEHGVRVFLKRQAFEARAEIARALAEFEREGNAREAAGPIEIELPTMGDGVS